MPNDSQHRHVNTASAWCPGSRMWMMTYDTPWGEDLVRVMYQLTRSGSMPRLASHQLMTSDASM